MKPNISYCIQQSTICLQLERAQDKWLNSAFPFLKSYYLLHETLNKLWLVLIEKNAGIISFSGVSTHIIGVQNYHW